MRQKLVELRETGHMTQEHVARAVGISRSFYGLIETGDRNPTFGLAKRIAEFFKTRPEEIFFDLDGFRTKLPDDYHAAALNTGTEGRR